MAQEPKVGDFVVTEGSYSYSVYEVTSLSQKIFKGRQAGWMDQRKRRDEIVFVGTEEQCCSLAKAINAIIGHSDSVRSDWLRKHTEKLEKEVYAAISKATGGA